MLEEEEHPMRRQATVVKLNCFNLWLHAGSVYHHPTGRRMEDNKPSPRPGESIPGHLEGKVLPGGPILDSPAVFCGTDARGSKVSP